MSTGEQEGLAHGAGSPKGTALANGTRVLVAALMVLTAILFWVASAVEKSGVHQSVSVQSRSENTGGETAAAPEGSSERESAEAAGAAQPETATLGINLEAPWVVYAVIIGTVVVVIALVFFGYPILFLVILLAAGGIFLDARELVHQVAASRLGLSSLVAAVALTRVATAAVALGALLRQRGQSQAA